MSSFKQFLTKNKVVILISIFALLNILHATLIVIRLIKHT